MAMNLPFELDELRVCPGDQSFSQHFVAIIFFMPAMLKIMFWFPVKFYRIHMNLCQKTRSEMDVSNFCTYTLNLQTSINFIYHSSFHCHCWMPAWSQGCASLIWRCSITFVQPASWGSHHPHLRGSKHSPALQVVTVCQYLVWLLGLGGNTCDMLGWILVQGTLSQRKATRS